MSPEPFERAHLERLRERIARADRTLVDAYLDRRRLVRELLAYKVQAGIAPFDPAQEAQVVARARSWAVERGASALEAEELMVWVLRQNHLGPAARPPLAASAGRR